MRPRFRLLAGVIAALGVLSATTLPTAAKEFSGTGFHALWDHTFELPTRGIVVVDRTAGNKPRLTLSLDADDRPMEEITFNFRSIGCGGTPAPGNRVFDVRGTTNSESELYLQLALSRNLNFEEVRSVWMRLGQTACVPVDHFLRVAAGDVTGDDALAQVNGDGGHFGNLLTIINYRESDFDFIARVIVHGMEGNDEISLRGVNRACGRTPTNDVFSVVLKEVLVSSFQTFEVEMTKAELQSMRSVRVKIGTQRWCAPAGIIMANSAGDL